ncbi:CENP-B protein, partial [Athelia psychrophila]
DGNQQLIMVVDCICADGTVLPPLIIMKGKKPSYGWVKDSELEEGWIAASPNGWTDNELGLKWMEHVFDPATREKANGKWRCLVLDNHESHISLEFIDYTWSHKIIVVSLAPKTSGKTQPLDVAVFSPYQMAYGRATDDEVRGGVNITKQDFTRILPKARKAAFTRANILRGFEQTGIWPFNRDVF